MHFMKSLKLAAIIENLDQFISFGNAMRLEGEKKIRNRDT